jgi:hypothetical protein
VLIARSRIAVGERERQRAHAAALRLLGDQDALGGLLVTVFGKGTSTRPGGGFDEATRPHPPEPPFLWESGRGDPRRVLAMDRAGIRRTPHGDGASSASASESR